MGDLVRLINMKTRRGEQRWLDLGHETLINQHWYLSVYYCSNDTNYNCFLMLSNSKTGVFKRFDITTNFILHFRYSCGIAIDIVVKAIVYEKGYPLRILIDQLHLENAKAS